jgi:hypothetical protein
VRPRRSQFPYEAVIEGSPHAKIVRDECGE